MKDYGVWRDLNDLNLRQGGKQAITFGSPGSGKTTLLQNRIVTGLKRGEVCVWRAGEIDSFNAFANLGRLRVLVPGHATYEWAEMSTDKKQKGRRVDPEKDWGLDLDTFGTVQEAVEMLEAGKVNVIVTVLPEADDGTPREQIWWTQFANRLNHRLDSRWILVAMDEVDDLIQDSAQGLEWYAQRAWKKELRHARKRFVNLDLAVHNYRDVRFDALTKFRFKKWLRGARRIPGHTRLYQKVLDALPLGKGIVEAEYFEDFSFDAVPEAYQPDYLISVECIAVQDGLDRRAARAARELAQVVRRVQQVEVALADEDEDVET